MQLNESPTKMRWQIIALVFLIYMLMFIDRINISIAAKFIMPEYGLTQVEFGWIFSSFVLGYALAQIPGGWLGDRYGPRRIMTWAIIWWSVFTAVTALAGELFLASIIGVVGSFAFIRVLTGLGEAAAPPNGNRIVANWAAPRERAFALGLALSGTSLGAALTPPLIVWIMVTWGWREAFYVSGAAGILVALLWYWLSTDGPAEHPRVNAAELKFIQAGSEQTAAVPHGPTPWRKLLGARDLLLLTAAYFVLGYIVYFYFAWFYLYLVDERGFSLESGGFYTMAPFLTCAVAGPFGGWLSDLLCLRYGKRLGRCGLGFASMMGTGILLLIGAATEDSLMAVVLLSASLGTLYLSLSPFWAVTIDLTRTYAGTASGFMNMGGNLGGTISPTITPYIAQNYDWSTSIYVMGVLSIIGSLCWLGIHPEREIDFGDVQTP
ncbi:MAG: ACS family glucarate transporter-like MFS transporter [Gammaproteobacteria bacterium]|jgi:ACS family glucarate transporter-like MFS transporter